MKIEQCKFYYDNIEAYTSKNIDLNKNYYINFNEIVKELENINENVIVNEAANPEYNTSENEKVNQKDTNENTFEKVA